MTFPSKRDWAGIGPVWRTETLTWHTASASRRLAECKHMKTISCTQLGELWRCYPSCGSPELAHRFLKYMCVFIYRYPLLNFQCNTTWCVNTTLYHQYDTIWYIDTTLKYNTLPFDMCTNVIDDTSLSLSITSTSLYLGRASVLSSKINFV